VVQLMDKETLSRDAVMRIFGPVQKRPVRGSYTGYGKRLPSDRPPVLTKKELALTASEVDRSATGNGQGSAGGSTTSSPGETGEVPGREGP
jgi:cell division protease FtsH